MERPVSGPSLLAYVISSGTLIGAIACSSAIAPAPGSPRETRMSRTCAHRAQSGRPNIVCTAALLAMLVVISTGCADVRKTLWAEMMLDVALQRHFHVPITVVVPADGMLSVTAQEAQADANKLMPWRDRARGLRIAKFARSHYSDTAGLRAITVYFMTKPDGKLQHLPHMYPGMTWSIRSLDIERDPAPTVIPNQSSDAN
jgi:hypothetical protein